MENATKALLIAAAILIAILIISLSLVIYNMAAEQTSNADLTELEVSTHNSKFKKYEGATLTPDELLPLQRELIAHNQQEKQKGTNRIVKLKSSKGNEIMFVDTDSSGKDVTTPSMAFITQAKTNKIASFSISLKYTNGLVTEVNYSPNT